MATAYGTFPRDVCFCAVAAAEGCFGFSTSTLRSTSAALSFGIAPRSFGAVCSVLAAAFGIGIGFVGFGVASRIFGAACSALAVTFGIGVADFDVAPRSFGAACSLLVVTFGIDVCIIDFGVASRGFGGARSATPTPVVTPNTFGIGDVFGFRFASAEVSSEFGVDDVDAVFGSISLTMVGVWASIAERCREEVVEGGEITGGREDVVGGRAEIAGECGDVVADRENVGGREEVVADRENAGGREEVAADRENVGGREDAAGRENVGGREVVARREIVGGRDDVVAGREIVGGREMEPDPIVNRHHMNGLFAPRMLIDS